MRITFFVIVIVFLCSPSSPGESTTRTDDDSVLARLSYAGGYMVDWREQTGSPGICFALYRSGRYRISRLTEAGNESLQGKLSEDAFDRLTKLLIRLDSESSPGGIVQKGAESFIVEIAREQDTIHQVWVNPDHQRPLPESVMRVVYWLQDFEATGAHPLTLRELSNQRICPTASEPLLPVISCLRNLSVKQ